MFNAITFIDSYKLDHRRMYPPGTEYVYSNWTPRGSRIEGVDEVVFFGLQHFLEQYLERMFDQTFFEDDEDAVVEYYERRVNGYLGPNNIGTDHIRDLHRLGYLPLEFKALPEGTLTPLRVPMFTVENTHPDFFWLVNYIESIMSNVLWMSMTSATIAKKMRGLLDDYAEKTGSPKEFVDWQGHDFSFRGMSGLEAGYLSGMGHLTQFTGTDTMVAVDAVEEFYPVGDPDYLIGGSVAATEHSVMCAGGKDGEFETYNRLLDLYPSGILAIVSDTWDLWKVLTETLPALKDKIMARDGKIVIRPDSGDPVDIVCGTQKEEWADGHSYKKRKVSRKFGGGTTPEEKGVVELLWDIFGGTITETGHKLLDPHIGVIYGDSINYERAQAILERLDEKGFASGNMVFGMGSYGYQHQTRDTFGFAMKATNVTINGVETPIFKDPVTDDGTKKSLTGRIAVLRNTETGKLYAVDNASPWAMKESLLETVWKDGKFIKYYGFDEVRANARK